MEEPKKEKKKAKKDKKEAKKELNTKQIFMMKRNEARKAAGIKEMAYSEEDIANAK